MIENYDFGKIKIDGKEYDHDVIVYPAPLAKGSRVYPDKVDSWWRKESHSVVIDDIKEIIDKKPETIIFGTGEPGLMKVADETKEHLEKQGIEVIIEPTKKACDTFNKLSKEEGVVAALHLTC